MSTKPSKPPPPLGRDDALGYVETQIEAITGDWKTSVRIRSIDQRFDVPRETRLKPIHLYGSLADQSFCDRLFEANKTHDLYVTAQDVSPDVPPSTPISQAHITAGRVLVADFDGKPFPAEFHIPPTAILRRADDPSYFWALWSIAELFPVDEIAPMHKRAIKYYGSDPTIFDIARIIRLAGFVSHKRPTPTYYRCELCDE